MFFNSHVLQYINMGLIGFGTITVVGYIGSGLKALFTKKKVPFTIGIVDSLKKQIKNNDGNADIMFMLSLEMFVFFGSFVAIAFWVEKLIQIIF